ncbi:MAG: long-chain fatty acid--CoA ligase [Lachnospiraceae bacterium]|nr:long-chain fatty acid--CoA ligase [Lachnospiraceae bacterium]
MSEVYIRSQNRQELYILNNSQGIRYGTSNNDTFFHIESDDERQTGEHYIFLYANNGGRYKLGEYESKERCIEIIDEIQGICGQYLYAPGNAGLLIGSEATPPMAAVIPRVYQMPEKRGAAYGRKRRGTQGAYT